ncbi:uncharacterized protein B0H64DRAFT_155961 [Chaetomium fimeti]|uniref:DUF7025 domain-containing protein n=1 Tax=Chaetomium fimeti TaxID=1854472 RepID=A0AAE0HFY4_9PEZI|nr:hypothetical protein B0H64DRAFT_155961 [Chaetomium fimeti]
MPQNDNNEGAVTGMEGLLNALIGALEGLKARPQVSNSHTPAEQSGPWIGNGATDSSPSPSRSTASSLLHEPRETTPASAPGEEVTRKEEEEGWMWRLGRSDGNGGWTRYDYYLQSQSIEVPEEAEVETPVKSVPGVLLDMHAPTKTIIIESPHLMRALDKFNWHLSSKHPPDMTLYDPFPFLYHHLEGMREEIDRLGNPEAQADLKALECALKETGVASRWNAARAENVDSSHVRFDTLWQLFRLGDLVVHTDGLGNEWLLTLMYAQEHKKSVEVGQTGRIGQMAVDRYMEFWTWGLSWNGHKNKLERKASVFRIDYYAGAKEVHLLSIYPLQYQRTHDSVEKLLQGLAARGRHWFKLVSSQALCLDYDGPALSGKTLFNFNSRVDREPTYLRYLDHD